VVPAAFAGAAILAGYVRTRLGPEGSGVGVTTEVAAMMLPAGAAYWLL
jgi:hypothetical protein